MAGSPSAPTASQHAQRLRVSIDPPAALDREQVAAEIARREASIALCRGVGGRRPLAAGSVRLQLALDQSGQVRDARVLRSDLGQPDVELCLTLRLRLWRLPVPRAAQDALVEFSLDWRPDDPGGLPAGVP